MVGKAADNNPRVMIAAAGSGSGKTVMTCALLGMLKDRGLNPAAFKCGPDYIDPMFHRIVTGTDSLNLDMFMAGADGVRGLVASAKGNYAVIEGVMGIFDGVSADSIRGSSYEIAKETNTPIILAVNASGAGRTLISLVKGILADDDAHLIKGIIFSRMSDSYMERSYEAFSAELSDAGFDAKILGNLPKTDYADLDSRHLGLKMPHEIEDIKDRTARISALLAERLDIDAVIGIMENAGNIEADPVRPYTGRSLVPESDAKPLRGVCLAVARDEAFCFYYAENIGLLEDMGASVKYFSPLRDKCLPEGANALLLGGGYPELYLEELSKNTSMLDSIRSAVKNRMPSLAECGGFMYLHDKVCDREGKEYALAGLVKGKCTYSGHLVNFGYTEITGGSETLTGMKGHEFHYYESSGSGSDLTLCKPSTGKMRKDMTADNDRLWGWPHLYYPSKPEALIRFLKRAGS